MRSIKKLFINIVAVFMLVISAFSLTACEDIKKLEVEVLANDESYTIEVELYRHLAPATCDKVIKLAKAGYYNDALIYINTAYSSQLMVGDLKFANEKVIQNKNEAFDLSTIKGEFTANGVSGSNLTNVKGAIGMWRTWYAENDQKYLNTSSAMDSGYGVWYLPTSEMGGYNDYFCVFAQIDLDDEDNSSAYTALSNVFSDSTNYVDYTIYYTVGAEGYDDTKDNCGLTYHCVPTTEYNSLTKTTVDDVTTITYEDESTAVLFVAEGNQLVCFNKYTVKIATDTKIVSVNVK